MQGRRCSDLVNLGKSAGCSRVGKGQAALVSRTGGNGNMSVAIINGVRQRKIEEQELVASPVEVA